MLAALVLLAAFGRSAPALAAASEWQRTDAVAARLLSAASGTGSGGTVSLGLELNLQPGWKTYWRSPGDAGLPPRIDWSGSSNLAEATLSWPAPIRFTLFGLETFGYQRHVVLPITARPAEQNRPLVLRAGVDLLVCHDICVPAHFDLSLDLPTTAATPSTEAELIADFGRRVPGNGTADGLTIVGARDVGSTLEIEATAREPFTSPDLFIESEPPRVFKAPELHFDHGDHHLIARLVPGTTTDAAALPLTATKVTVTLTDGDRALEASPAVTTGADQGAAAPALAPMLAMALLGGLILNLMPCVLPVLSIKLLSVVKHGGGCVRAVRADFMATAAGILFSFLVLAGVMIALKSAGAAVGWGIQFQQPLFLAAMAVVVSLFACNLWGIFEIPLPRFIAEAAAADPHHPGTLAGPFVAGAFATLLATPCSAPFLGTAIGFALARGATDILAVFATLGLGLALPYLAVAAIPRLATALPRPGRWMIGLRRLLGSALAGTALWLLWLLPGRGSPVLSVIVGALIVGLALTLTLRSQLSARRRRLVLPAAGLLALAAVAAPAALRPATAPEQIFEANWQPLDLAVVRQQVAAGHLVFVDVTADWCLTCIANKRLVLDRPEITARLHDRSGHVIAMRADWTHPNDAIARYLASFERYGIPFNVVYGPAAPNGLALPELLTPSAVLDGITRAEGTKGDLPP